MSPSVCRLAMAPLGSRRYAQVGAAEVTRLAAGGQQMGKFLGSLALGVIGMNLCDNSPPDGGTSNEPPPVCSDTSAQDGVCR